MQYKKNARLFLVALFFFPLFYCRESSEKSTGWLKEEIEIFEKSIDKIQYKFKKLKEAELNNQLQNQLDLRRELDALIQRMNNDLRECSEKQTPEKIVPFIQPENPGVFEVSNVNLMGCSFNEEIMDAQVQLAAVAKSKENKNDSLRAELFDSSGRFLKEIKFYMTNDYPEKGKTLLLLAHIEGINLLKSFAKIRFN